MTPGRYVWQSLWHHRYAYLGVLAGAVLGATVLFGALFAGDSVGHSLREISALRIGRATHVLTAGDRTFRQVLATEFAAEGNLRAAPVLYARGTANPAASSGSASRVQLVGLTEAFWQFAPTPPAITLDPATPAVAINELLARRLRISIGDTMIVRLQKPGIVSGNAPVAGAESSLQSLRCTVAAVVNESAFGRFSLEATQVPTPTVFLPIERLQETLEQPGRANLMLLAAGNSALPALRTALIRALRLADYGLSLRWLERAGVFELTSQRIFLDPAIASAVTRAHPEAQPVVSYLVNEFRAGNRTTPYSVATATTAEAAPFLPPNLGPRDLVLNEWLADDLQASVGDEVRVTYFQSGAGGALIEAQRMFRVHSVVPLQGLAADKAWMPDFPGISDVDRPGDWDPGLPLVLDRIRDKDERYWTDYRGAPKAFLSLEAGRELWSARWGTYTAFRFAPPREPGASLETSLLAALEPEMNQLLLRDFRAEAQGSAESSVDFAGLFIGMSFFLILAALGLVAMLFQLSLLQRNREDALLGAVGLSARTVLRWRLAEGAAILALGCLAGLPLAMLYTRGILRFLETIWAGQDAGSTFRFAASPASILGGGLGFLLLSLLAIGWAARRRTRQSLSIRLAAHQEDAVPTARIRRTSLVLAVVAGLAAAAAVAVSDRGLPAQAAFYLAGFALLTAGIAVCRWWMATATAPSRAGQLRPGDLGGLNVKARRARSLTVVGLIATAVFMVLSVASFRKHVGDDWLERGSGTGGFAFWIETSTALNLSRDGRTEGFEALAPHAAALGEIVPLRAGIGDNVNCFNLNTTSQPRLLAVDSAKLAARGSFAPRIPAAAGATGAPSGWEALRAPQADGAIPALVDETTLLWALKRKVGDVLTYADENGRPFSVRIAGTLRDSLFQGYVLMDEALFLERFPSNAGYSAFLIDARPGTDLAALRNRLEGALRDAGGRVELTRDVLAAFHQVENTYIAIFNVLGSLGVILGSLGLAIVVARNLRERRGEFAVMTALGIPRGVLGRMVFAEFGRLVAWGIAIGAVASAVAIGPNLTALPPAPTALLVAGLLAGIVLVNLATGSAIFRWSVRGLRPGVEHAAA